MTRHLLEVWVTVFGVFALGSLLGWLVYRWIERTDYAYDQHELARRVARLLGRVDRLAGEEAVEPGEALLAAGGERIRRRYRRRGAPDGAAVLRERVQTSSLAAAWRQRRHGEPVETRTEPVITRPIAPIEGEILPKQPAAAANGATPPRPAPPAAAAPPPPPAAVAPEPELDDGADDATWEPVAPVTWPGIRSWPQIPGRPIVLLPPPGSPPSFAAAVPPRPEDIWGEELEEAFEAAVDLPEPVVEMAPAPIEIPPPVDLPVPEEAEAPEPLPTFLDDDETFFIEAVAVAPDVIAPIPEPRPEPRRPRAPEPPRGPTPMPPPRATSKRPASGPTVRIRPPSQPPPLPAAAKPPTRPPGEGVTRPKSATALPPSSPANGQRPPGLLSPPARPDALRRIKGIGPGFETRLHELGIYRYAQIASWTPEQQRWIGTALGASGRIERDHWVTQATELMKPKAAPRPAPLPPAEG
ncbi:MAG: hypothetical protein KIS96_01885 [Bauldia sp.]|nr:hypothetical protein [Bauldia sp.]